LDPDLLRATDLIAEAHSGSLDCFFASAIHKVEPAALR